MPDDNQPESNVTSWEEVAFAQWLVSTVAEGATVVYMEPRMVFKLSHSAKTLQLVNPAVLNLPRSMAAYVRTVDTFAVIGYLVFYDVLHSVTRDKGGREV